MSAFDTVYNLFWDDVEITFENDKTIPVVLDPDNPINFEIRYDGREKIWYCRADFVCEDEKDQWVTMVREYTADLIGQVSFMDELFAEVEDESVDEQ